MDPSSSLAARYAELLASRVYEGTGPPPIARHWSELEIQALWFAGLFGSDFSATDGRAVRIVQFGVWNREAGPDFAEASVSFEGAEPLRGAIELDTDIRDWERHGHATNPDYEKVILHLFLQGSPATFFTRSASHRLVPQVALDPARLADAEAPNPLPAAKLGRCSGPLGEQPPEKAREILLGAARHRLNRKVAAYARLRELHGPDEALYQMLAATLGYKRNKLPFTLLAQRLPLRFLLKMKEEVPALLFGLSSFLPDRDFQPFDPATRRYLRALWEVWWTRRNELGRLALAPGLWKLSGQRPANHPQRRIAAMASLVRHWPQIRSLSETADPKKIESFFSQLDDPFWNSHYTLSAAPAARPMALVGSSRVREMLANVFLPLAVARDESSWAIYEKLSAPATNRQVETAAVRLFGAGSFWPKAAHSAALQQGLLQIYEDFCLQDVTDCAACRFPEQLARW